jgi:hypothetical protein
MGPYNLTQFKVNTTLLTPSKVHKSENVCFLMRFFQLNEMKMAGEVLNLTGVN